MRLFSATVASCTVLLLCLHTCAHGYYFSGESNGKEDDLATLESTPGVSIVYPRAVGPEAANIEVEGKDVSELTTTAAPTTTTTSSSDVSEGTTTTAAPPTTQVSAAEATTTASSSEATSTLPGMD